MNTVTIPTRVCSVCEQEGFVHVPEAKLPEVLRWFTERHDYIQNILPDMPPEYREMLITGIHPDCWKQMFAEENEEGWGW